MDIENTGNKQRAGIKSYKFTPTGSNGESHRKNARRKNAQHLRNVQARAALYQERGRISAAEWHTRLNAISQGTI